MPALLEPTCKLDQVAIIFNPASGPQDCAARRATLEKLARAAGVRCELQETLRGEGAAPLARKAVDRKAERVLISGGDGSVAEAAAALVGTETALAVLPGGTGNLLAVNLGIPGDCEQALHLALNGPVRPIDVGRANGHVFLIMAGIGADASMIRDADRSLKKRFGVLAYAIAAWKNLGRRSNRYRISIDGHTFRRRAQTVLVANLGRITGGLSLIPDSNADDGLLEVAVIRARSLLALATVLLRRLLGLELNDDRMQVYRGRRIVVHAAPPQPVQIDGNDAGVSARLEASVEPEALKIVRPQLQAEPATSRVRRLRPVWFVLTVALIGGFALRRSLPRPERPLKGEVALQPDVPVDTSAG